MDADQTKPTKPKKQNPAATQEADKVERWVYRIVLFVMAVVPLLAFLFSFGNVGDLGVHLGVDKRIAYLTGPGVDLFVTGLNVAATWLSHKGRTEKQLWPVHALSAFCGLIMFALNCGPAFYARHFELAGFNAVGPFLLIAMGLVGPWLLRQLADAREAAPARHKTDRGTAQPAPAPVPAKTDPARVTAQNPGTSTPAGTAPGTARGTDHGTASPAAPERANPVPTTAVPPKTGTRTSFETWVERAVPLWNAYVKDHHERPIAAVLGNRVRTAFPEPDQPMSDRWDRKLRKAVREAVGDTDDEHEAVGDTNNEHAEDEAMQR